MPKFIHVCLVDAEEMDFKTFYESRNPMGKNIDFSTTGKKNESGYFFGDNITCGGWVSESEFLKDHFQLVGNGTRIWPEDIDSFVDSEMSTAMGYKTSIMQYGLCNGYEVTATATCIDTDFHDSERADKIMRENLNEKVRELLGFLLQCAKRGFRN